MVSRAGRTGVGRRTGIGCLERTETRPDRRRIYHRTAAPSRTGRHLAPRTVEPQRVEDLFSVYRSRRGRRIRRQPRPLRILGLPARQFRIAISRFAQRGDGERHGGTAPAATAGRSGGLRRHGVVLPRPAAVFRGKTPSGASGVEHAGLAVARRGALPADSRRRVGSHGQCFEGLFQRQHVSESCGGQSALFFPLDLIGRRQGALRIRVFPRDGACGDLRTAARRSSGIDRSGYAAAYPPAEYRAVSGREFRTVDGRRERRRRTRSAQFSAVESRRGLFR